MSAPTAPPAPPSGLGGGTWLSFVVLLGQAVVVATRYVHIYPFTWLGEHITWPEYQTLGALAVASLVAMLLALLYRDRPAPRIVAAFHAIIGMLFLGLAIDSAIQ